MPAHIVFPLQVDFDVEMFWNRVNGERVIQAHAPPQRPVLFHPDTGKATWFCNVHSHSNALRSERDGEVCCYHRLSLGGTMMEFEMRINYSPPFFKTYTCLNDAL